MNLAEEFSDFVRLVRACKSRAEQLSAASAAASITWRDLQRLTEVLQSNRARLTVIKNAPGIGAHAQAATNLPGADLAADYTSIVAGIDTVIAEIDSLIPRAGGYASVINMETDGTWIDREFAPGAQGVVDLRAVLDAFVVGLPSWIERQT